MSNQAHNNLLCNIPNCPICDPTLQVKSNYGGIVDNSPKSNPCPPTVNNCVTNNCGGSAPKQPISKPCGCATCNPKPKPCGCKKDKCEPPKKKTKADYLPQTFKRQCCNGERPCNTKSLGRVEKMAALSHKKKIACPTAAVPSNPCMKNTSVCVEHTCNNTIHLPCGCKNNCSCPPPPPPKPCGCKEACNCETYKFNNKKKLKSNFAITKTTTTFETCNDNTELIFTSGDSVFCISGDTLDFSAFDLSPYGGGYTSVTSPIEIVNAFKSLGIEAYISNCTVYIVGCPIDAPLINVLN